jgi:lipopolysaccharide export system permease protein
MARLAQSSEFTILRTSGLGPVAALGLLMGLGVAFAVLTFVVGDYIAPIADQRAQLVKAEARGGAYGRTGAWLKDRHATPDGERTFSIQVQSVSPRGELKEVRIFEFDPDARLIARMAAASATIEVDDRGASFWRLSQVQRSSWRPAPDSAELVVTDKNLESLDWPSTLTRPVVAAAVRPPGTMSTLDLFRYMTHLADNEQAAQRYEIQFWKKALYPLACLVMVALALPFAYLHGRSGGISLKVFGGIMLGISFVLLNNISTHVGLLQNWVPWIAAATPSTVYFVLSLLAFNWLVRHR